MSPAEIQSLANVVLFLIALVAIVGIALVIGWMVSRSEAKPQPPTTRRAPANRTNGVPRTLQKPAERRVGLTETPSPATPSGDLVPVAVYTSATEANEDRDRLRAAGIEATLVGDHAIRSERSSSPALELHVPADRAEAALALLDPGEPVTDDPDEFRLPVEKADDLVTIATFDSPIETQLAQARLEEAGIRSTVADAQLIAMDWIMSNAVGRIKLQVLGVDAASAMRVLNTPAEPASDPSEAITADPLFEEEAPPNEREENAERAYRAAMFGVVLWPLQFYTLFLLLAVVTSRQPLRPDYHTRTIRATLICLPFVVVMLLPLLLVRLRWFGVG